MATITKDLGPVSAYAYAVAGGYTGTEEEFEELLGNIAVDLEQIENLSVTVTTLPEGSSATASYSDGVLSLGIPKGDTGNTGATPDFRIGTVTTGAAGTDASASITGTAEEPVLNLTIPRGDPGEVTQAEFDELAGTVSSLNGALREFGNNFIVSNSEQLIAKTGETNTEPYTFRASGGGKSDRVFLKALTGGSVVRNQIIQNGNFSNSITGWDFAGTGSRTTGSDGLTITSSAIIAAYQTITSEIKEGHVYAYTADITTNASSVTFGIYKNASGTYTNSIPVTTSKQRVQAIKKITGISPGDYFDLRVRVNVADSAITIINNVNMIDLTEMLGSTIADYIFSLGPGLGGSGIQWFNAYFPEFNSFQAYNPGTFAHVSSVSQRRVVGVNQWDEQWEQGSINDSTGVPDFYATCIRSKNYIPVIPGLSYYLNQYSTNGVTAPLYKAFMYDADKNFIGLKNSGYMTNNLVVPDNCRYIKFRTLIDYGNVYKNDICINVFDPAINGQYFPYESYSYPIDDSITLMGIPKIADGKLYYDGDTYPASGQGKRRYILLDLGVLTWEKSSSGNKFYATITTPYEYNASQVMMCSKYTFDGNCNGTIGYYGDDKTIRYFYQSGTTIYEIYVHDEAYSSADAFGAAMSGVYLLYKLATPTDFTAEPFTEFELAIPGGTEEFVTTGIPVGHESFYPENLRAKIEGLPWDFASLIAPVEKTYKATQNYTVGSLLIVNNILYQVTVAIANNGAITPGTNCTPKPLSEIIAAL